MKKSISVNRKSRGRPRKKGGVYPVTAVRLPPELVRAVSAWAENQKLSRSDAVRQLVERGLQAFIQDLG
jgi:Ribbon-helix-helix protein, copG family